jgi:hypothetical protein
MANPSIRKQGSPDTVDPVEPVAINDARAPKERIEPDQIREWAKRLNVSTTRLREAVQRAGSVADDVRRFLKHH